MFSPDEIQAFGVCIAAAALLVNVVFHWHRYRHDKISRNISASMKLVEEWRSLAGRKARANIREHLIGENKPCASSGITGLSSDLREDVKTVSYLCDEIGARVIYGEADPTLVNSFLGHSIAKTWDILEPYILSERRVYDFPVFQAHFEAQAKKTSLKKIHRKTRAKIKKHVGWLVYRRLHFRSSSTFDQILAYLKSFFRYSADRETASPTVQQPAEGEVNIHENLQAGHK